MAGRRTRPIHFPKTESEKALGEFDMERSAPRPPSGEATVPTNDPPEAVPVPPEIPGPGDRTAAPASAGPRSFATAGRQTRLIYFTEAEIEKALDEFELERSAPRPPSGKAAVLTNDPGEAVAVAPETPGPGERAAAPASAGPPRFGSAPTWSRIAPSRRSRYKRWLVPAALGMGATMAVMAILTLNRWTTRPPLSPIAEGPPVEPVLEAVVPDRPPMATDSIESREAGLADALSLEPPSRIGARIAPPGNPEVATTVARATPPPTLIPLVAETSPVPPRDAATTLTSSPPRPIDPSPAPAGVSEPEPPQAAILSPATPSRPPAESLEAPAPPPSTSPAVSTPPAPSSGTPLPETGAIERTLGRYRNAFSDLDVGAARQVWPTVDERALRRAFDGLETQDLSFDACLIDVTGLRAEASCSGTASYVRKIGGNDTHVERRQWKFSLRKVSNEWLIDAVAAR